LRVASVAVEVKTLALTSAPWIRGLDRCPWDASENAVVPTGRACKSSCFAAADAVEDIHDGELVGDIGESTYPPPRYV